MPPEILGEEGRGERGWGELFDLGGWRKIPRIYIVTQLNAQAVKRFRIEYVCRV